ncbi:MAG: ThuA domain-containing protein [Gammaproteobacteria bacterium]|jgi:type 1 glutamine amidotransferase|nr:ThuA domain-containing protein [Gammaproteobacteria bacterium]
MKPFSSIWLIALLLVTVNGSHVSAKMSDRETLHILLLADEKDHGPPGNGLHDYPLWQEQWQDLLSREEAFDGKPDVQVAKAWHWPSTEQFKKADLIVAYCYLEWTDERLDEVRKYLDDGGGLVLIHSASWTKPEPSPEVAEVVGVGGFELFRHGTVKLDLVAPEHPVCAGLPSTIVLENDETYWPPTSLMEDAVVLATSVEEKGARGTTPRAAQPACWCFELGRGRVFGCVPGHNIETFENPDFQKLLLQGMNWAANTLCK